MRNSTINRISRFTRGMQVGLALVACCLLGNATFAQTAANYQFSTSTGAALNPMTGSTTLIAASSDDGTSTIQPMGFNFVYEGTTYTQYSVNVNGLVRLGGTLITGEFSNAFSSTTNTPKIMPSWDDHHTGSIAGGGKVHTVLSGSPGSFVRMIEWFVTIPRSLTGAANARFQCWLYEGTNVIEFRYGTSGGTTASASVGLGGATVGNFLSVTTATGSGTASNSTANNSNTTWPAAGTMYTFAAPSCSNPIAPSAPTATAITNSSATIGWAAGSFATSYSYEVRTSGSCGSGLVGLVASGSTASLSATITGLNAATTYTYCVRSVCSGVSSYVSGTFTTLCNSFPLPLNEGFNSSSIPTCWSQQFVSGTSGFTYPTSSSNPTTTPFEGTNYVFFNSFSFANGNQTRLVSPALISTGTASVDVNFRWFNDNNTSYNAGQYLNEGVQVQWSLNGVTWTDAGPFIQRHDPSLAVGTSQWKSKSVTLPVGAGNQPTLYVGFRFVSAFGDNCSMDAVGVTSTPTCSASNSVSGTPTSPTSATINWSAVPGAVGYNYEVRSSGACGSGLAGLVASGSTAGTSATITGLTQNTAYTVCVVTNCGSSLLSGFTSGSFTTPFAAPSNDLCANAIAIPCGGSVSGNNTGATDDVSFPACIGTGNNFRGVWYTYTPPTSGSVTLGLCGGATWDTYLRVFSGTCNALSCITNSDDFCSTQSQVTFTATAGTTYYVLLSGFNSTSAFGPFTLTSTVPTATVGSITPPTQLFCGANGTFSVPSVSGLSYNWTVTNGSVVSGQGSNSVVLNWSGGSNTVTVTATNSCGATATTSTTYTCTPPPPCNDFSFTAPFTHSGNTCGAVDNSNLRPGEEVIYKVTIPVTGCYTFSLCGGSPVWDSYIYLTTLCPGSGGTSGGGTILASNDDFCGSFGLSSIENITLTAGTYYLTIEPFSSGNCNAYTLNVGPGVPPAAGAITGSLPFGCGSSTTFSVNSVSGVTYTWSTTNGTITSGQGTSTVTILWGNGPGTVSVTPSNVCATGATSSATFNCTPPPANDLCSNATPFVGSSMPFSTVFATGTDLSSCTFNDFNDVWFAWTAPSCGTVTFNTCGSGFDTHLSLFTSCTGGTELACNDDFCSLQSSISANVTAGTTYFLRAAGYNGAQGNGTIFQSLTTPLAATASHFNVSCFGGNNGSASVTVSGGSGATSIQWSNGATTSSISGLVAGTYTVTVSDAIGCSVVASTTVTEPTALSGGLIAQTYVGGVNVTCNGASDGMIFANISGGILPYNYAWSNGGNTQMITGLTAGSYSVVVTDANGCTYSQSITLIEPAVVTSTISAATFSCGYNVSCNGASNGSIDLTVTGGSGNYIFNWSNGATTEDLSGLAAGTYSVVATDQNGCSTSASITLTEPALLTTSLTGSSYGCGFGVSCFGASNGSITAATTGGCAPYTYTWSNSGIGGFINGVPAGTYAVTVTDANGCQAFATKELTSPALLVGAGTAATYSCGYNVSCNGASNGSISYAVTGGCAPYTYAWSNGATSQNVAGLTAGTYSVVATDANGCTTSNSFTLTQPAVLVGSGTVSSFSCGYNVSCNGASNGSISYSVSGGCAPYSYAWSNGATTQNLTGLTAGSYSVVVTDANGCSTSNSFTLTQPAALVASGVKSLYNCGFNVSCNGAANGSIDYSVSGGCAPYTYAWSNGATTQDVSGLTAGSYSVVVTDANGCSTSSAFNLTQPAVLTVTCPANTTVYLGWPASQCATLTATGISGGCAPYTIAWSNGATTASTTVCPTVSTDYTVVVTDANGCSVSCVTRVCVLDVRCGNNLNKITICHNPPGNAQTLCISPNAFTVNGHISHGDYLGACGSNVPCAAPLKTTATAAAAAVETEAISMEAFPNPFTTSTTLRFTVPADDQVTLTVFGMDGRNMGIVFAGEVVAQKTYEAEFKGNDVTNGIYFAKLVTSKGEVTTLKLVLMK